MASKAAAFKGTIQVLGVLVTAFGVVFPRLARAEQTLVQVTAAYGDTCVRKIDGTAWCWGFDGLGDLGDGTQNDSARPVPVVSVGAGLAGVSAGQDHTCALKSDGTVWCWGYDLYGQLGVGTNDAWSTPVQVTALGNTIVQVSTGYFHTCARKSDGSVWCWGLNALGQLGDNTENDESSPVQVAGLSGSVADVSAGFYHTCAVKTDGTVWCWGDNASGQIGDGSTTPRLTPSEVSSLGGPAAEVSANNSFTCARRTDGTLWCWGGNTDGELGNGSTVPSSLPVQVNSLGSSVIEVSAGDNGACARKNDHSLWCWGSNFEGNVGDGTTLRRLTPVPVTALGNAVAEVSMGVHTCARKTDGTVWCWGHNGNGQLGDGSTTSRSTPVEVPILTAGNIISTPVPAGDWRTAAWLGLALLAASTWAGQRAWRG